MADDLDPDDKGEVTRELAETVLAAEKVNAIKEVEAGGKLSTPHRREMVIATLTPTTAQQHRVAALLERYCKGDDLTPEQWAEIRAVHPGFSDQAAPAAIATSPASSSEPPAAAGSFQLTAEGRAAKLTAAEERHFSALYGKGWRTLRRWIEIGEQKGEPCPLAEPAKMPAWWNRNMTWRLPPEIEAAGTVAPAAAAQAGQAQAAPPAGRTINLADYDPEEGSRLRELKQIQVAKFEQLRDAMQAGEDTTILEQKYLKLSETIDKIESRAEDRLKKKGLFILREEVERDLAAAAEHLRQSRESMVRRVNELCPSLTAEQRAEVANAIEQARAMEDRILARLDSMTPDDLLRELAA